MSEGRKAEIQVKYEKYWKNSEKYEIRKTKNDEDASEKLQDGKGRVSCKDGLLVFGAFFKYDRNQHFIEIPRRVYELRRGVSSFRTPNFHRLMHDLSQVQINAPAQPFIGVRDLSLFVRRTRRCGDVAGEMAERDAISLLEEVEPLRIVMRTLVQSNNRQSAACGGWQLQLRAVAIQRYDSTSAAQRKGRRGKQEQTRAERSKKRRFVNGESTMISSL
ncbi:unnamed protein product [Toxocara canis]|uniref:Uncharacterized protein n=1 Tax=Toxocara canis TaxID=6265 RepID=A0A183TZ81_TOXCA|nr:unnamed protein product [Toxocara canis]